MATRYKALPDKLFAVRVPIICTYTPQELDIIGIPLTVDNDDGRVIDRKPYNNLTTCMLPLTKLVDIYDEGYPIYLVNSEDSVIVYEMLEEYLSGVVYAQSVNMLNMERIEETRLESIEKFANEMFGLNKGDIIKKVIDVSNSNNGYGLGMDLMRPQPLANFTTQPTFNVMQPSVMPANHTSYPLAVEDIKKNQESMIRPSVGTADNYSYVYNSVPEFNIEEIKRKPSYRKRFKV